MGGSIVPRRRYAFALLVMLAVPGWLQATPVSPPVSTPVSKAPVVVSTPVSYHQEGPRKAAGRIRNWVSGYQQAPFYGGTGTLVAISDGQGLVLTAAHLFDGGTGPITVEFDGHSPLGARLLAIDAKLDVAALWIYAPAGIKPVPIAENDPALGERLEIWGYGPNRFRSFLATVSEPLTIVGDRPDSLIGAQGIENRMVTIPGDSGGPMVQDGELVGVHWGYRGAEDDPRRCVHAVGCHELRSWLQANLDASLAKRVLGSKVAARPVGGINLQPVR
jgi:S1-C subfamily serine protease